MERRSEAFTPFLRHSAFLGGVIALFCSLSAPAIAQQRERANPAAKFSVTTCFDTIDDISRVKRLASSKRWKPTLPEMTKALKPVDASDHQSWEVDQEGERFFVTVHKGSHLGLSFDVCGVIANYAPDKVVSILSRELNATLETQSRQGSEIIETYQLVHPTQSTVRLRITRGLDNTPPVIVTFVSFK